MKKYYLTLLLCVLFVFSIGSVNAKLFEMEEFYLDNGMRVIVIPNHKSPIIKHMVWYKVGSVDEPFAKGGLAHLLEHLMFRGTSKIKGRELNSILEKNGASSNAFTSLDMTAYHQMIDISRLELAMYLEADRMQNLEISEKSFNLERDIVFQERKQVVENNPASEYSETIRNILWGTHKYSRPVTGLDEEILNLSKDDAQNFYNKFYAPNNAILVLSGDIDIATAKILAKKYYGNVAPKVIGKKAVFEEFNSPKKSKIEMNLPNIGYSRLNKIYVAPSYNVDKNDIYNLLVLSKYLGEGKTSQLHKNLVRKNHKALSIDTSYNFMSRSYGTFNISAIPQKNVSLEELDSEIDKAIKVALTELSLDNIEKVKLKMLSGLVYLRDNPEEAAYIVGSMAVAGMDINDIENYADNIKNVSYKDVIKSANKLFNNSKSVTGMLKPMGTE